MKLYYCEECTRVFAEEDNCPYCKGVAITLKKNSPVNVIGTKIKGRVYKNNEEKVTLILRSEDKSKIMKEYLPSNLRKIL